MKAIALLLMLATTQCFALDVVSVNQSRSIVATQLRKKLSLVNSAFRNNIGSGVLRTHDDEAYYLKRIRLQYAPFVAFDVAVFELKVMPIIEFRWTRKNPVGWVNFKK